MPHTSSDHATGIKMQRQVRAPVTSFFPASNFVMLRAQSLGHRFFGYFAIGPRGSRGNISFPVQSLAKFLVGTADMFFESVTAVGFVASQIISRSVIGWTVLGAFCRTGHLATRYLRHAWIRRRTASARPEEKSKKTNCVYRTLHSLQTLMDFSTATELLSKWWLEEKSVIEYKSITKMEHGGRTRLIDATPKNKGICSP
jgi:hypothetical protein